MKVTKSSGGMPRLSYTGRDDRHFLPNGLYIIKTVNGERERIIFVECLVKDEFDIYFFSLFVFLTDPWTMAFSKNSKRKFFYNKLTKESTYALPPGSVAPFQ